MNNTNKILLAGPAAIGLALAATPALAQVQIDGEFVEVGGGSFPNSGPGDITGVATLNASGQITGNGVDAGAGGVTTTGTVTGGATTVTSLDAGAGAITTTGTLSAGTATLGATTTTASPTRGH